LVRERIAGKSDPARPSCGLRVTGGHEARFIGEYDGLYTIT
jgi:hypothetical protein